jgi:hypothetical protein
MRLFSKKPAQPPAAAPAGPPPVAFDDTAGNADAARLRDQMLAGDWRAVQAFLEPLTDWDDRTFYIRVIARLGMFPEDWVTATSGSQVSMIARGIHRMDLAWKARGSGRSQTVGEAAWPQFYAHLNEAEADLTRACDLLPSDPLPWAMLITTAQGLELPKEVVLRRFDEVNARHLGFRLAHVNVMNAVSQKWSGSHVLMFDIARKADTTLPPGSPGRVCIPFAHALRRQYYAQWEKDADAAAGYYKNPTVALEIRTAADNSVLSPAFVPTLDSPWPRADFALSLGSTSGTFDEDRSRAVQLFAALGEHPPTRTLWSETFGAKAGATYAGTRTRCARTDAPAV